MGIRFILFALLFITVTFLVTVCVCNIINKINNKKKQKHNEEIGFKIIK